MTVQPIQTVPEWTLGDRLRKARRLTGMTQRDFAAAIGEDARAYSQWEADNNRPRHLVEVCQSVEELTGVSAAWLLGLPVPVPGGSGSGYQPDYALDDESGAILPFRPRHGGARRHDRALRPTG